MNIFVSGGHGFLGTALRKKLKKINFTVDAPSSKECNLLIETSLREYSGIKYDLIFHLAAWTQAGDFCLKYPGDQWIKNQRINTNIIDWWKKSQPNAKFVFMGSSCVYAPTSGLKEEEYMSGEPINSLYTYAMTKRMLYQGAQALGQQFGLKWLCAVPSTLYGPNYHKDGRQMHFIFDLIRKIIRGKRYEEEVVLWGDGQQRRELIHVGDFVDRLLYLEKHLENEIVNIGAGNDKTIKEFAEIICDIVGYDSKLICYDVNKYVGSRSKKLSINKLLKICPNHYENMISIEEGIQATVEWFYNTKAYE